MTIITSNIENDSSDGYDTGITNPITLVIAPDVTIVSGEIGVLAGINNGGGGFEFASDAQIYNYGQIVSFAPEDNDENDEGVHIPNFSILFNESSGSIEGYYGVDDSFSGIGSTINNDGYIDGLEDGVYVSGTAISLLNTGTIKGAQFAIYANANYDGAQINNSGTIDGGMSIVSGEDTITNTGGIDGAITFTGTGSTNSLTNSGKITGAVAFSGGDNTVDNSGLIDGAVSIAHSGDTFTNTGTIDGAVTLPGGSDTFTNAGAIDGEVELWSTEAGNSMTNSGAITGNVMMTAPSSAITNHGQIYGNIILGASDTLTNTGTVHGNVTLGASDTFDVSPGIVTGVINASTVAGSPGDLFQFGGDFGKLTFDDFVAGTGTNHDTIQFAANDFGTFSQVQSASSQVGSDVLIKLDATDSITLNNVTLSSLVSADFKFV